MTGLGVAFKVLAELTSGAKAPAATKKLGRAADVGATPLAEKPDRCRVASTSHQHLVCF